MMWEAAARVLRGEGSGASPSISTIAASSGWRRKMGGSAMRRFTVSPRIAGLRVHNGEVVGDAA
jgi:hypothetical protein